MFHILEEGETPKFGFNFYPLSDQHSFGGKFKTSKNIFCLRYRKKFGDWSYWKVVLAECMTHEEIMKMWDDLEKEENSKL